jgi:hypothetical protein
VQRNSNGIVVKEVRGAQLPAMEVRRWNIDITSLNQQHNLSWGFQMNSSLIVSA